MRTNSCPIAGRHSIPLCAASVLALVLMTGCATMPTDTITQFSTSAALERADYTGRFTCATLARHGSLGTGYLEALGGTLILLDGTPYAAAANGKTWRPTPDTTLTQACAVPFMWDTSLNVSSRTDLSALTKLIDTTVPNRDRLCAVKITGRFLDLDICNPPRQTASKKGLSQLLSDQPRMRSQDAKGTLVGFRLPEHLQLTGEPGLTLFYLSSNLQIGGRAVAFVMQEGTIEIDVCNQFLLIEPGTAEDEGIVVLPGNANKQENRP